MKSCIEELLCKDKSRSKLLLLVMIGISALMIFIRFVILRNIWMGILDEMFYLGITVCITLLIVSIIHVVLIYRNGVPVISQDKLQIESEKDQECLIFIPLYPDELVKINSDCNIVEFRYLENVWHGKKFFIIQNAGLLPLKKEIITRDDDLLKCQILSSREKLLKINSAGLCLLVNRSEIEEIMRSHLNFDLNYVEVKNGTVKLKYSGCRVIKDKESLKSYLLDYQHYLRYSVSRYESLLEHFLLDCPDNEESVYPKDKCAFENQGKEFWINTPNAQMAIRILRTFNPKEMLEERELIKKSNLKQKVRHILNYIAQENIKENENDVDEILNAVKSILGYTYFNDNVPLHSDVRVKIRDVICEDLKNNEIYRYIFALASCSEDDKALYTGFGFRVICKSLGYKELMWEVEAIMSNYYNKKIAVDSEDYKALKLDEVLEKMSEEGVIKQSTSKEYSNKQLIDCAQKMICCRYMKLGVFAHKDSKEFTTEMKLQGSIILIDKKVPCVTSNVKVITNNAGISSNFQEI
ncbi:hypothetical protein K6025_02805 [Ehrlichia sp. JZT12]